MAYKQKVQKGKVYLYDDYSGKWKYQYDAPTGIKEGVYEAGKGGIPDDAIPIPAEEQKIVGNIYAPGTTSGMIAAPLDATLNAIKNLGKSVSGSVNKFTEPVAEKISGAVKPVSEKAQEASRKLMADMAIRSPDASSMVEEPIQPPTYTAPVNVDKRTQEILSKAKSQDAALEELKTKGIASKTETDAIHQANLAQEAKWAEQKKADDVKARIDAVSSQARHPWEPKNAKSPIVQMDEDIDKRALRLAGESAVPKKPAPTVLAPKPALEEVPASMVTQQVRPTSYKDEYARRYQEALAGRSGYTSSSTGGNL